ncbi:2-dehydropantoate 2-reductase [Thalassomonas viridans]|uniref:2-dehydropantoate 2-reductase n=1 Tax=Thalassomonas viridans TaxID=137584 RepID=A0AAF0C884_9GAMM|nr:2-dehydropantoate 2-reductase [Thalassomonas viridans]WDE04468.1 2-dehydropantoate 2-reductase [Thalassomonas viridans]
MSASFKQQTILLVGAGAVGATIAAWLAPRLRNLYVLDRGETLQALQQRGVTAYLQHHKEQAEHTRVKTVAGFDECPKPDIILLCVKNYSLKGLSQAILDAYGEQALKDILVVGLQNGVENQQILPQYFPKVVYGIISFNAWLDEPGVAGYQARGPFLFGTPDNSLMEEVERVTALFNLGVEAIASRHFQDAALSKMIINLTNSFTTLMGLGYREIDHPALFQKILSQLTYEGVKIVKASGHKECKVGDIPSWFIISASARLPQFLTRKVFNKNVRKMVVSSMAQDIIQNGRSDNELEGINGYLLALADKFNVEAPYNRAIYRLCRQAFSQEKFEPISVEEVWQKMAINA